MSNSKTCKVVGCNYSKYHTTERHCCGKCKFNGHGQIECGNEQQCKDLKQYDGEFVKVPCKVQDCIDIHTHTTEGHSCLYCNKNVSTPHLQYCPMNKITTCNNSICDKLTEFTREFTEEVMKVKINAREYKAISSCMGCTWFIRNNDGIIENNEYLFMHSDNWGQYGEDSSHLPRYKAFIYGYHNVNTLE